MKLFSMFSNENEKDNEKEDHSVPEHHRESSIASSSLSSRISSIFRGPPERQSKRSESTETPSNYKHTPTHASSSFIQTTTTTAMVKRDPGLMLETPLRNDPRFDDNATLHRAR
jgi:hypothetical protein